MKNRLFSAEADFILLTMIYGKHSFPKKSTKQRRLLTVIAIFGMAYLTK
jgi:hypothetical protein